MFTLFEGIGNSLANTYIHIDFRNTENDFCIFRFRLASLLLQPMLLRLNNNNVIATARRVN